MEKETDGVNLAILKKVTSIVTCLHQPWLKQVRFLKLAARLRRLY